MCRPVTPVYIELDRPRPLLLTFRGMKAFEEETGRSLLMPGAWYRTSIRELRALLWACLLHDDHTLTVEAAGNLVYPGDMERVTEAVLLTCEKSVSPPSAAEDEEDSDDDESEGGALTWLGLWRVARIDLGLSNDEFWNMTPIEFDALVKQNNLKLEREDFRAGIVASVIANVNRDPEKKPEPFSAFDFMPTKGGKPKKKKKQTWQEQFELIKVFNAMYGGDVQYVETPSTTETPEHSPE